MEKPIAPAANECCENGCENCVWDNYYIEVARWRLEQKAASEEQKPKESGLEHKRTL